MTVAELIERLQTMPGTIPVRVVVEGYDAYDEHGLHYVVTGMMDSHAVIAESCVFNGNHVLIYGGD